jgi:pimeloyl-ACP methyl ester carboxylesterase
MATSNKNRSPEARPHVVLVHGLAAHRWLMAPLAWKIKRAGFSTSLFGYRSWLFSIERHAESLVKRIQKIRSRDDVSSIHIVAHSMGGIVTRQALRSNDLDNNAIHRVVMLGTPNQGSPTATRLGRILPFAKTLNQLSDKETSFVRQLPEPDQNEFGTLAASYDWVVPETSGHLNYEADYIRIFSGHNGLLVRPTAARQVISFLKNGFFEKELQEF